MSNLSPVVNIASKVSLTAAVSLFIVAILTLILITYNESASIRHENIIKSRLSMQSVITVLEEYKKDLGYYPSDISQLTGVYLSKTPLDIWGNASMIIHIAMGPIAFIRSAQMVQWVAIKTEGTMITIPIGIWCIKPVRWQYDYHRTSFNIDKFNFTAMRPFRAGDGHA